MSMQVMELTVESLLPLIEKLSVPDKLRLRAALDQPAPIQPVAKAPLDKRVLCEPMPDRTREWDWIEQHKHEYSGQWVALDGDRLVAASPVRLEISAAIKADSTERPLIHRIPSPDDLPYVGTIWIS